MSGCLSFLYVSHEIHRSHKLQIKTNHGDILLLTDQMKTRYPEKDKKDTQFKMYTSRKRFIRRQWMEIQ